MQENIIGDMVEITHEKHSKYVEALIRLVQGGDEPDVPMNEFIEKIMKNKKEYKLLCNAIFLFINNRPATKQAPSRPEAEAPPEAPSEDPPEAPPEPAAPAGLAAPEAEDPVTDAELARALPEAPAPEAELARALPEALLTQSVLEERLEALSAPAAPEAPPEPSPA